MNRIYCDTQDKAKIKKVYGFEPINLFYFSKHRLDTKIKVREGYAT